MLHQVLVTSAPPQKPGVPLARGTLITHCCTNLSFMDFICTMVTNSIQVRSPSDF